MIDTEVIDTLNQPQEEVVTQVEQEPAGQQNTPQEEDKREKNLKILREKATRAERERDEAIRRLQEIEARSTAPAQQPEDDEIVLGPDELAEGKHISRVTRKVRRLEEKLKAYEEKTATEIIEAKLKSQYPDFDAIVTKENIEALKSEFPEVAHTIHSSTDVYSKAASAYKLIKRLGIAQDNSAFDAEKAAAQKNAYKPKPTASIAPQQGDTPLSKANAFANGLTPELQAQLLKEMQAARRAL